MKSIELLAPAQNKKSIKAVANLANAVYFGTDALNMRMNANNISIKDLPDVVEFCHSSNLKAYLTSNVIFYENELDYLENLLKLSAQHIEVSTDEISLEFDRFKTCHLQHLETKPCEMKPNILWSPGMLREW